MSRFIINKPPARALVLGMRAIGYNFATAVADIIDNSISADAKMLHIYSDALADIPYFCFLDDGEGMDFDKLKNAMLLGSDRQDKTDCEAELGRFGLGLKSASLSQCREFIVVTKQCDLVNAMSFDLDEIEKSNDWTLKVFEDTEIEEFPCIEELIQYKSGTLVIWTKFDRMSNSAKNFEETFRAAVDDASKHASLVFHRYYNKFYIYFDGIRVENRDPFLLGSAGRQQTGRTQMVSVDNAEISITPYTLPFANTLSAQEKALLGNPKSIYDDQGFYIYRNKRLIFWGSWMRMGVKSELNKLARILVDIPSTLDSMWSLDVKKSSAKIPDKVKEKIWAVVKDSTIRSSRTTRFPGLKEQSIENKIWERTMVRSGASQYSINRDNPVIKILQSLVGKEENVLLDTILSQVECYLPKHALSNDINDSIEVLNNVDTEEEDRLINQVYRFVLLLPIEEQNEKLEQLLASESYKKIEKHKNEIKRRLLND